MKILKYEDLQEMSLKNFKMLIYGEPYVGKTTFAATFPKPLIISTDGNIKGLYNVNKDLQAIVIHDYNEYQTTTGIKMKKDGWTAFKEIVDAIVDSPDYETIVVDLFKDIYDYATNFVKKKLGIEHESEDRRFRVWKMYDDEVLPVLRKLMTSDKNVILITHDKEREVGVTTNLIGSLAQKVTSYTDLTCRFMIKSSPTAGDQRVLYSRASSKELANNRLNKVIEIESPTYEKFIKEIQGEK